MTESPFSPSYRDSFLPLKKEKDELVLQNLNEESLKLQKQLKSVNQELIKKENLLSALLKTMSDGMIFLDLEGKILLFNPIAEERFKMRQEKLIGQSFWDIFDDLFFGFSMKEALRFGISQRKLFLKDLEISSLFLYEGSKSHHGMLLIFKDIKEKEELKQTIQRNERIQELGKVALTIAHEIKNPLGGIRGYASLLFKDLKSNAYLQEMAGFILEGTKSLEKIVNGILHYSKPIHLEIQTLDLTSFLRELAKFIKMDPALGKHIRFSLHVPDSSLLVPFDPIFLKSALLNLIFNAIQAMPRGGELTVFAMKESTFCQIHITDTGEGICEEQKERLFSPFFTTKQAGHGLGLVEVKKIIQAHLGTIDVRSWEGKGTTFTIHLPLRR